MKITPFKKSMTIDEREELMRKILGEECLPLGRKKSHDYGGEDCWGNLRRGNWQGIVMRLCDKADRLFNVTFYEEAQVNDESLEDTLIDIINYAMFTLIMYRNNDTISKDLSDEEIKKIKDKFYKEYSVPKNPFSPENICTCDNME